MKKTISTFATGMITALILSFATHAQTPEWTKVLQMNTFGLPTVNVVTHGSDYLYLAGSFSGPITFAGVNYTSIGNNDLLIAKVSKANVIQWVKQFNAQPGGAITPVALKVDGNGNLLLAATFSGTVTIGGNTFSSSDLYNSFYAKFSNTGDGLWATPFFSTGSGASKVAVDSDGNSFLMSKANKLMKFNSSGVFIWEQNYPLKTLQAIAVYGSSLYLGGALQSGTTNFGTLALTSLGGYNTGFMVKADLNGVFTNSLIVGGSTSGYGSSISDILPDGNGNLIITGCYTKDLILGGITTTNSKKSYYTYIGKCDPNFAFTMARTSSEYDNVSRDMYNYRLFLDSSGNIYEYGMIDHIFSYNGIPVTGQQWLVKFNADGTAQKTWALEKSSCDRTVVDSEGKVIIGGTFDDSGSTNYGNFYLTRYNTDLVQEWQRISSNSMAGIAEIRYIKYDETGNTYIQSRVIGHVDYFGTVINSNSYLTVISKHDIDGNLLWKQQIADINPDLFGPAFILDKDNNILTIGLFSQTLTVGNTTLTNTNGGNDGYVAKFSSSGNPLWASKLSQSKKISSRMTVASDNNGNAIVSGTINLSNYLIKFNATGNLLWSKSFPMESYYMSLVSTDAANNIYMTSEIYPLGTISIGSVTLTQTNEDGSIVLIKFDPDGNALWAKLYGGVAGASYPGGWPCDIKTDAAGNSILWGWCMNNANFGGTVLTNPFAVNQGYSYYLTKINTSGDVVWAKAVYETKYGFNYGDLLDMDGEGNIYAGGHFTDKISIDGNEFNPEGTNDYFTAKFSATGEYQWITTIPSDKMIMNALSVYDNDILSVVGAPGKNPQLGGVDIIRKGGSDCIIATQVLLNPAPNSLDIGPNSGDSITFCIFSNTSWTASSDQSWLTLNMTSGTGNALIIFTVDANPTAEPRTAIVTITYTGKSARVQTLTIVQAGSTSGIPDITESARLIYPNPAETVLYFDSKIQKGSVFIYNSNGMKVLESPISDNKIDVRNLPDGLYVIRIFDDNLNHIDKFIKN